MILTLGDEKFALRPSILFGHLGDPYWQDTYDEGRNPGLGWALEVDPEEFHDFPPRFTCGTRFSVRRWVDLTGATAHFKAPYGTEGPHAYSVTHEWEDQPYSTLHILDRIGATFQIRWEGVCDLHHSANSYTPFHIETQAVFEKIQVQGSERDTMDTLAKRLSQYIDIEDFIQHPIKTMAQYESGVQMCCCIFEPKV